MENVIAVSAQSVVKSVTKTALVAEKIYKAQYQKDKTLTVQLRQSVVSSASYPSQRAGNDMNGTLYGASEFGFSVKDYSNTEKRVGWTNVPENETLEGFTARLAQAKNATLYKVLSNRPILTGDQQYAINAGIGTQTMDTYAASQVIRYPDTHETKKNQIVLDQNGKVQYRAIFFAPSGMDDMDARTADKEDAYVSAAIVAELNGAPTNATIVPEQALGQ